MKKLLTVLAVLAIATAFVSTNASAEMNLEFGAKGGLNLASMWGEDADSLGTDTSMRTGFLGGAFLGMSFNETWGGRLELLYAMRGQKVTVDFGGVSEDVTFKLDYVEIAFYGTASFPAGESGSVYVLAGPYVGFNTKAEISADSETEDISDSIASMDFGIGAGAGFGFMASESMKIFFEGQYNAGLMTVVDDEDADLTIKNSGIAFSVGVAIPLSSGGSM